MTKGSRPKGKAWCVLLMLLFGETPSTMEIIHHCNITRPGSVIHYLRKEWNVPIETEIVRQVNSEGELVNFARYRIPPSSLQEQRERFGL